MFSWISFLTYAVITAATPGPNNIISLSNGGRIGFQKALPFNFGMWAGFSVVILLCTLFMSLLNDLILVLKTPMMFAGAGYMLHLGWKILRSRDSIEENHSHTGFWQGFALQFINPKGYIYCLVSMEAFILPHYHGKPLILIAFALLLAFIGFAFTICWSAFGSVFKLLFSKYSRITNPIMALLLVYCALSLFL